MHKRAFTLVELIVVITILAILGTITFISLQGYSGEARDSKRGTDVRKMLTKLNLEQTSKGLGYKEMLKSPEMHNLIINGDDTAESYEGTINFELLKESPKNFRDPDTKADYEFATANGTSNGESYNFIQGRYWSEKDNKEIILGNYYQFLPTDALNLFKKSMTGQEPETPIPSTNSCNSTLPNISNIITTPGTPTQENQSWQNDDNNEACYYTCEPGYDWTDSTKTVCYELTYAWETTPNGICSQTTAPSYIYPNTCDGICGEGTRQATSCTAGTGTQNVTAVCKNTTTNDIVANTNCTEAKPTTESCTIPCASPLPTETCDTGVVCPTGITELEASTIGCGENNPDIIATINGTKLRIAGCNASGTSGTGVPISSTYTETGNISGIPGTIHYYYTWQNAMDWCSSKGWRLPTKDEFDSMISTFGWIAPSPHTTPYSVIQAKYPYFMYSAGCWPGNCLRTQGSYAYYWSSTEGNSNESYYLLFNTLGAIATLYYYGDKTTCGHSVRCVKNY